MQPTALARPRQHLPLLLRGENHSAMRPGSLRLRSPSEGRELPTIVAVGQVQDKVLGMARRMGQGDEPLP